MLEARSTATCANRLRELAHDEIRPVRVWTAFNFNTPADALDELASDDDEYVWWVTSLHLRTPEQALVRLADQCSTVRTRVAHHPNAPEDLRQRLLAAGACRNCSPMCSEWRIYNDRQWHIRYQPSGLFRRT